MDIDWVRRYCLSLPGATEQVQWEDDLVFKVGGKMFAVAPLEAAPVCLSFKCTPEEFAELVERPRIKPAAYLARAHWVSLESEDALPRASIERLLTQSRDLAFAKLTRKKQAGLLSRPPQKGKSRAKKK
jgi:predicted DNA-binding protein (MmcQ/YjbR family)